MTDLDMYFMERDAERSVIEKVSHELAQQMRSAFVNKYIGSNLFFAASSIASARWDDIRKDVRRGRYTVDTAIALYRDALSHHVVSPAKMEMEIELLGTNRNLSVNQQKSVNFQ